MDEVLSAAWVQGEVEIADVLGSYGWCGRQPGFGSAIAESPGEVAMRMLGDSSGNSVRYSQLLGALVYFALSRLDYYIILIPRRPELL